MADREKAIRGLECCLSTGGFDECREKCPYYTRGLGGDICSKSAMRDALSLLKAQEPLAVRITDDFGAIKFGNCPKCGSIINNQGYPKSCGCGQAVKWVEPPKEET